MMRVRTGAGVVVGVVSVFCCAAHLPAQGVLPSMLQRKLVSMTVTPGEVQNGASASPVVTLTFDRAFNQGTPRLDTVWVQTTAQELVAPPSKTQDLQSNWVPANGFVLVPSFAQTSKFNLQVTPGLLTASKPVSLRARYGESVVSTSMTVTVPPPNSVASVTVTPTQLENGVYRASNSPQFTVTLAQNGSNIARGRDGKPTQAAERVWVDVSNDALLSPPKAYYDEVGGPVSGPSNFVLVPWGQKSVTFPLSVSFSEKITTPYRVTVTARNGGRSVITALTITPQPPYRVTAFQASPATFRVGQSAQNPQLTLTLDRPVTSPPGMAQYKHHVAVSSSAADLVEAPAMEVPLGSSTVTAMVNFKASATSARDVTFTPSGADPGVQASVHVVPIQLKTFRLSVQPVQPLYIGTLGDGVGTVEIDYANMVSDVNVNLTSMEPDVLNFVQAYESNPVQHVAKISRASAATNFHVWAMPATLRKTFVGEDRQVTIAADYNGQRMTAVVPVIWPRAIASLVVSPPNQYGSSTATVTLDHPAPAGGMALSINSANRAAFLTLPTTVRVNEGQTSATFALALKPPRPAGVTVTVTGTPYWNTSATATVPAN